MLDLHLPRNVILGFTGNVDVAYFLIDDCSLDALTSGTGESFATMFEVWASQHVPISARYESTS